MVFGVADIPDLTGRVAVVTGANGGLGLQTATVLAAKGAHVWLAARDERKTARSIEAITGVAPDAHLTPVPLDLGDLASVRDAAAAILSQVSRVDLLVNNAGIVATPLARNSVGQEMQLATNYLGAFALTGTLLPFFTRTTQARIVNVGSLMHRFGKLLSLIHI